MTKMVLVTGGGGFIGSHLCHRILADGDSVICLDNFTSGDRRNVDRLATDSRFTLVEQDVCEPMDFEVDLILNLACPASPVHYQLNPVGTVRTNVLGAINVLELGAAHGVPVFQASTSEVYGDPDISPQPETYWGRVNPLGPRACYDEGKRCAETLFFDYRRQRGVQIKIARLFNTYGPHMRTDDGRVVSNFIVSALRGTPLEVYGDGLQTRSFCYVDDIVDGIMRFMHTDASVTGPVNLGSYHESTMLELASAVIDVTGSRSRIVHRPLPEDDPRQRRPDLTLAKGLLDWTPTTSLDDGLTRTAAYFDELLRSA